MPLFLSLISAAAECSLRDAVGVPEKHRRDLRRFRAVEAGRGVVPGRFSF